MQLQQFKSAVRDWLGDPPNDVVSDNQILFYLLSSFDFYAAQLYNAQKGRVEYKVVKTPVAKETDITETFAFGEVSYVRRRMSSGEAQEHSWADVDVADSIVDLDEAEARGSRAVYFYSSNPVKMMLSWTPDAANPPYLELWGEKVLFTNLSLSAEVTDIQGLFHHLVTEHAAKKAVNLLFKKPELNIFAREVKSELREQIERREVIWRNYLAGSPDRKRIKQVEPYSPMNDLFYANRW